MQNKLDEEPVLSTHSLLEMAKTIFSGGRAQTLDALDRLVYPRRCFSEVVSEPVEVVSLAGNVDFGGVA
jgi:hypothetical protein